MNIKTLLSSTAPSQIHAKIFSDTKEYYAFMFSCDIKNSKWMYGDELIKFIARRSILVDYMAFKDHSKVTKHFKLTKDNFHYRFERLGRVQQQRIMKMPIMRQSLLSRKHLPYS